MFSGERELVEFLQDEIAAEKKAQKVSKIPTEIDGFKVKLDGAEVELTKQGDKEKIVISFNVNHTVDTDLNVDEEQDDKQQQQQQPNFSEMKSKPNFDVDIIKSGKTLSFTCAFINEPAEETEYGNLLFFITIAYYITIFL